MDLAAHRCFQNSEWIRARRDELDAGGRVACPVRECDGTLAPYDLERDPDDPRSALRAPGGVRCPACHAESRPVAL